ncbi:MAG: nitronate monooxygenase [Bdellovibrionales bacterium]|nr:nitronate monooxygenase [Bdellovibrionales bacterium]
MTTIENAPIQTSFTELLGCRYPIIAGPMFLVSDENLVSAVSNAGGIGAAPSLNWRTPDLFREAVRKIKTLTDQPFGINLIVNQANPRVEADLAVCVEERVPFVVTSLGNPKEVIRRMHEVGGKVFCDVTTLEYALKVQELGADGVIAVSAGAGGHAGPTSPLVLIPYLRKHLRIPVVLAGGVATGEQVAAAMLLGASAVQIGTRFIATNEAKVDAKYKNAVLEAEPDDIVMTYKLSGTPAAVINTPYVKKSGLQLNPIESFLMKRKSTKKLMKTMRFLIGSKMLQKAAMLPTWKEVWSAGQAVGLIEDEIPAGEVVRRLVSEYYAAFRGFDPQTPQASRGGARGAATARASATP